MVAARSASLPLLPTGVSEEEEEEVVVWAEVGGASACLVNRDMGMKSGSASEVSATGNTQVWMGTGQTKVNSTKVEFNVLTTTLPTLALLHQLLQTRLHPHGGWRLLFHHSLRSRSHSLHPLWLHLEQDSRRSGRLLHRGGSSDASRTYRGFSV